MSIGEGKCSVPVWQMGVPAGSCNKPAFGKQTKQGKLNWPHYVPNLACERHGGPYEKEHKS